jgi:hypothetical protein
MVEALRWPTRPLTPIEVGLPSVKARAGSWQVLHATVPSADRRPSKKSFSPRAIFSGVCGLSGGIASRVASAGRPTCWSDFGWANGPASGMGRGLGVAGRAASSDRAGLPAPLQTEKTQCTCGYCHQEPNTQSPSLAVVILNRPAGASPASARAVGPTLIKRRASRAPSSILERHWFRVADLVRPRLRATHTQALRSAGRCGRASG